MPSTQLLEGFSEMTPEKYFAQLRESLKRVPKEPWRLVELEPDIVCIMAPGLSTIVRSEGSEIDLNTLSFIAESRRDIPILLSVIEAQAKALEFYATCSGTYSVNDSWFEPARKALSRVDGLIDDMN